MSWHMSCTSDLVYVMVNGANICPGICLGNSDLVYVMVKGADKMSWHMSW